MKTFIKLLLCGAIIVLALNNSAYSKEKIKIGLIVPLSGENSAIGEKIIKSIRMAVNKIDDEKIEILPRDTKSNPINALKVSKELYQEGVRIIIGPVFNESNKYLDDLIANIKDNNNLSLYEEKFKKSWAYKELYLARNVKPSFTWGLIFGIIFTGLDQIFFKPKLSLLTNSI